MSEESKRQRQQVYWIMLTRTAVGKPAWEVAKEAGVSERTVHRHWKKPDFQQRVAELQQQMAEAAAGRLMDSSCLATEELQQLLSAKSEHVRLGAARSILSHMVHIRGSVCFNRRIQEVEELCEARLRQRGK